MTEATMPVTVEQDHERIYLQPKCCADQTCEGRQWCEDAVWEECDCANPQPIVEYVRADLAMNTRATPPSPAGEVLHGIDVARTRLAPLMKYGEDAVWRPAQFAYEVLGNAQAALTANASQPDRVVDVLPTPWQPYHGGTALSFEPGVFNLNRSGSASLAFAEDVIEWETDDESGKTYLVANLPAGEAEAIRKWLNEWLPVPELSTLDANSPSNFKENNDV